MRNAIADFQAGNIGRAPAGDHRYLRRFVGFPDRAFTRTPRARPAAVIAPDRESEPACGRWCASRHDCSDPWCSGSKRPISRSRLHRHRRSSRLSRLRRFCRRNYPYARDCGVYTRSCRGARRPRSRDGRVDVRSHHGARLPRRWPCSVDVWSHARARPRSLGDSRAERRLRRQRRSHPVTLGRDNSRVNTMAWIIGGFEAHSQSPAATANLKIHIIAGPDVREPPCTIHTQDRYAIDLGDRIAAHQNPGGGTSGIDSGDDRIGAEDEHPAVRIGFRSERAVASKILDSEISKTRRPDCRPYRCDALRGHPATAWHQGGDHDRRVKDARSHSHISLSATMVSSFRLTVRVSGFGTVVSRSRTIVAGAVAEALCGASVASK